MLTSLTVRAVTKPQLTLWPALFILEIIVLSQHVGSCSRFS